MNGRSSGCRAAAALVSCFAALAVPAVALGTTVELHDGLLTVDDPDGVANVLEVRQVSLAEFEVTDGAGGLVGADGCESLSDTVARCAGQALGVRVDAGAGDDLVGLWSILVPVRIHGGDGDDGLAAGLASDQVWGGAGRDSLSGSGGEDRLSGEEGGDFADGDDGADTILGGTGDDILDGRAGSGDVVSGGEGQDLVYGGAGDDQIDGNAGDDTLVGGAGRDDIATGLGRDDVFGGGGRVNEVDCRQGDRARGQAGELPPGCAPMPASEQLPDRWPPVDEAMATRSQTVYTVYGKPVQAGEARKYWLWVGAAADVDDKVRVRVKLRRGNTVLLRRCHNNVWTNKRRWRKAPRAARSMTRLTGRVRRGKRCP